MSTFLVSHETFGYLFEGKGMHEDKLESPSGNMSVTRSSWNKEGVEAEHIWLPIISKFPLTCSHISC